MTYVLPLTGSAGPAVAQHLGGGEAPDISFVRLFLALLFCVAIAGLAILLVRARLGGRVSTLLPRMASRGRIRMVESRRISAQAEIALVDCDGTEYLLLLSAGGPLLLLAERASPANPGD